MIPNRKKMALSCSKKLSSLLKRITSKHYDDFYCLNCLHSFRTKTKLNRLKNISNKEFCNMIMRSEDTKILQFNQNQVSDKATINIYTDFKCIIEKIDGSKNNPENPSATKVNKHIASCFSTSSISSFKSIEKQHYV